MVRLKFVVSEKTTRLHWDKSKGTIGTCKLLPVNGGSDENKAFYDATPSGSVEFGTINQSALDSLPLGAEVYIDLSIAPKE
jgi:hypothetical protein